MNTQLAPDAIFFDLDEEAVLLAERSGRLLHLNGTATFIWRGLENDLEIEDIAYELADAFSADRASVLEDCMSTLDDWRAAGLLASAPSGVGDAASVEPVVSSEHSASSASFAQVGQRQASTIDKDYRIGAFRLRLTTGKSAPETALHRHFSPVREKTDSPANDCEFLIQKAQDRWLLFSNGILVGECRQDNGLVPLVHAQIMYEAYRTQDCLAALHCAAVRTDESDCILLAGAPGSGKSTLTATAIKRGFTYLADDTVFLSAPSAQIHGLPMPLGLKEPSWEVISPYWSTIDESEVYRRGDERLVKYLVPENWRTIAHSNVEFPAKGLVFVKFAKDAATELHRVSTGDAMVRLAEAGYDLPGGLTRDTANALIEWLKGLDKYSLRYSALDSALEALERLSSDAG